MGRYYDELKSLAHPYYIVNIFMCSIFFVSKTLPPICTQLYDSCQIDFKEYELLIFLACVITVKGKRQASLINYLTHIFMFTKLCNLIMFYQQNILYAIVYALVWIIQFTLLSQPVYRGPDKIIFFRESTMDDEWKKGDDRVYWLVEFYAAWSPPCIDFSPLFAELSQKYGLENFKFAKLDVTRHPNVAVKYKIDNSSWSKQLPTVILFKGGKEIERRPAINIQGKVTQKFVFTWEAMVTAFGLNDLYTACKDNPIKKKATTAAGDEKKKTN